MKFDDMKMKKIVEEGAEVTEDQAIVDLLTGSKIVVLFHQISNLGHLALLCSLVESAAKERGITSFEYLDEIRQTIKEVRGDGRQAEDS